MNKFLFLFFIPIVAFGVTPENCEDRPIVETPELIEQGRDLFFNETFSGNGRTCSTCHREEHNFVIDAEFIKTLPKNDPLFVSENNPDLKDLENSKILHSDGLILENLDGFDKPPVFRAVQTILGLRKTLSIGVIDNGTKQVVHETGWSGDGAPGDGSLRCFAVGAVIQHFPKTLNRVENIDFRLPTDEELDALTAFQLNIGRQETQPLSKMKFSDPTVQMGAFKFSNAVMKTRAGGNDARRCGGCHVDGGAGDQEPNQVDRQRVTNVSASNNSPFCKGVAETIDGGLGKSQEFLKTIICGKSRSKKEFIVPMYSDIDQKGTKGSFNISSLWEAVETAPFFHDHSAKTVKEVLDFYESDAFNDSEGNVGRAFVFTNDDRKQLSALLHIMSVLENLRSAEEYLNNNKINLAKNDINEARKSLIASKTNINGVKYLQNAQRNIQNIQFAIDQLQIVRKLIVIE